MKRLAFLLLIPLLGMGRMPDLEDSQIFVLREPGCPHWEDTAKLLLEVDFGDDFFALTRLPNTLRPGDCVSLGALHAVTGRACCTDGDRRECSDHADITDVRPHCDRIFAPDGKQYGQGKVDEWNAGG